MSCNDINKDNKHMTVLEEQIDAIVKECFDNNKIIVPVDYETIKEAYATNGTLKILLRDKKRRTSIKKENMQA